MRNIFLFIRRHFNLLFFLFLQVLSIYFIAKYSKFHEAALGGITNEMTGKVNSKYYNVQSYFHLKSTNDSLLAANEALYNRLQENFQIRDTSVEIKTDTLALDSLEQHRTFRYMKAHIVSNSLNTSNNYMVLDRGKSGGVFPGMGVIDPVGSAIGIVVEANENYAVVMSLLHKDSHISGKLQTGGETGTLNWNGGDPSILNLTGVSKSAKVKKGDEVITSGYSTSFPKGMKIGKVEAVYKEKSSNLFRISIRTAANFHDLQMAYVIENKHQESVKKILDNLKIQP
ncbi:MAG: rod shape-determining protein MreC [Bacteroidota bacterium]